jgi:hypothetical protein
MHRVTLLVALALALSAESAAVAAIIVNPAQPITHRVTVQVIQTALDNGSSPAAVFGDPSREAAIKDVIDTVWSQAGIDVNFLPNTIRYNNTFAYQGAVPGGVRPITDLGVMMANAQLQGGILHPDPSVINMFFVNVVPGWNLKSANWVNGAGNIGANGIAVFVGSSVSAEHAGHWIAHELGHNLGLAHTDPIENLMLSCCRRNSLLTTEQVSTVFQTQFPKPLATILGDYDRNGRVETSDFAVWRKSFNSRTNLAADGNNNGIVDNDDYMIWRRNFGNDAAGSALGTAQGAPFLASGGIPEPASAGIVLSTLALLILRPRAHRRR